MAYRSARRAWQPAAKARKVSSRLAAYGKNATISQIRKELSAIASRGRVKGFKPDRADILATYRRNLARQSKAGITARAKAKSGGKPSVSAVEATYRRYGARTTSSLVRRARGVWTESKHPRTRNGKWTRKSGG